MASSTSQGSAVLDDLQGTLQDTEALLEQAAQASADQAKSLYARIAENLQQTKAKLVDFESAAVDKAKRAAKATDTYVHEHPWQAVGIGVAFGVLIGMLVSRR